MGDLIVESSELKGVVIPPTRAPSMIDEFPILSEPLDVKNGYLSIPEGPGLGVKLDMKMVNKIKSS